MKKKKLWAGLACFANAIVLFFSFLATWKKERSLAAALLILSAASTGAGSYFLREYEKEAHTTLDEPYTPQESSDNDIEIPLDDQATESEFI